jgi:hypothetical protein
MIGHSAFSNQLIGIIVLKGHKVFGIGALVFNMVYSLEYLIHYVLSFLGLIYLAVFVLDGKDNFLPAHSGILPEILAFAPINVYYNFRSK